MAAFKWLRPEAVFSVIGFVIWWYVRDDYGISWDQAVDLAFGEAVWNYLSSGGDYSFISRYPVENLVFYGSSLN